MIVFGYVHFKLSKAVRLPGEAPFIYAFRFQGGSNNSADPTGSHPPLGSGKSSGMAGRYWKALPSGLPWWHVSSLPSLVGDCCSGRRLDRKLQIGGSASFWAGYHCSSTWLLLSRPFEKSRSETPHAFSSLEISQESITWLSGCPRFVMFDIPDDPGIPILDTRPGIRFGGRMFTDFKMLLFFNPGNSPALNCFHGRR